MKLLIELQYLPPVQFFQELASHDELLIEACENYQKQTYRNRCRIRGANKVEVLIVPVKKGRKHIPARDVKIDYSQKWLNVHWRAIMSAYGKAPFFEFYADYFHDILFKRHNFLFDLNMELLSLCLKLTEAEQPVTLTKEYSKVTELTDSGINDQRGQISPKVKNEKEKDTLSGYQQIFGKGFEPNLSVIDLLFCEGPEAGAVIRGRKKER